jgi:exopolysaccharide biosynthesis polyprenyl glycosylphosphotransferase
LLSALALACTLALSGSSGEWQIEMMASVVLIRMIYRNVRGPRPVLVDHSVRRHLARVIEDEFLLTMFLMAATFALAWPVALPTLAVYAGANLALQFSLYYTSRLILHRLIAGDHHHAPGTTTRRVLILGTGERGRAVADMILDTPELDSTVVGFLDFERTGLWSYRDIPLAGSPKDFQSIVAGGQCDALFMAADLDDFQRSGRLFETAEAMGVPICLPPNLFVGTIARPRATAINGTPLLTYRAVPEGRFGLLMKRTIDRIGSLVGIILASPIMLACAIAISLESRGPILFKQVRSGRNGRPFYLYKFRTMCLGAEQKKSQLLKHNEMSGPVFKMKRDPRITPIGAFLRKYSLDELPQFFNVLRGEMSLVGPRPPLPKEVARYDTWQRRRLSVKPGLTCLWQVNGRNAVDFEDWMKLDLQYIDNWSLWLDLRIMAKTIPTVLRGTGI